MSDLISVIIPVKNGSKYIKEAIDGIQNQNMDVEIIVVDDSSSDDTVNIAENLGCKVVKHDTSMGAVAGKNSGLKAAQGEYILFHDCDDILANGSLQRLYNEFEPDIMAVEAKVQDWYSPDLPEEDRAKTKIKQEPYWGLFR